MISSIVMRRASIAASITEPPSSARRRVVAHEGEQFAPGAERRRRRRGGFARGEVDADRFEAAARRAQPDDVAVAQLAERAAAIGFGRDVDRGGDLAARPRHAPVGDQRDLVALVLEHAERAG